MKIENNKYTGINRLEAFSDGVFAIAITLLVLELIEVLHMVTVENLLKTFWHHWEPFLAFFIGFITILICWINHNHALKYIEKVDDKFMWVNGFLLFMVTLTPFCTAILAETIEAEGKIALLIFGANFFLIASSAYLICKYAYNHFFVEEAHRAYYYIIKKTYWYSIFYTLFAFFVCFISMPIAIVLYLLMFAAFALPNNFATYLLKRKQRKIAKTK